MNDFRPLKLLLALSCCQRSALSVAHCLRGSWGTFPKASFSLASHLMSNLPTEFENPGKLIGNTIGFFWPTAAALQEPKQAAPNRCSSHSGQFGVAKKLFG